MKLALALIPVLVVTGCAAIGGTSVHKKTTTYNTDGTRIVQEESGWTRPSIAWGDARQVIGRESVSTGTNGTRIGITGIDQTTSATNVAPTLDAAGKLIGNSVKTLLGLP